VPFRGTPILSPLVKPLTFFGDPSWRDLLAIAPTRRVFIYAETSFSPEQVSSLQAAAETLGHDLQFRDAAYAKERIIREKPLAFISHDSRDKESIARPIALNLQRKICPVWYDEFSLPLGANLRESIERGLKECKRCVLILSGLVLLSRKRRQVGALQREADTPRLHHPHTG